MQYGPGPGMAAGQLVSGCGSFVTQGSVSHNAAMSPALSPFLGPGHCSLPSTVSPILHNLAPAHTTHQNSESSAIHFLPFSVYIICYISCVEKCYICLKNLVQVG